MSRVNVWKETENQDRTAPVFAEVDALLQRVREKAFAIFMDRGHHHGHALDDWLAAERELCWPAVEFVADDNGCELEFALPGYEAAEIEVTAMPREVIVHAWKKTEAKGQGQGQGQGKGKGKRKREETVIRWSGFRDNEVYRRVEPGMDIDVEHVKASLKNGILKVVAPTRGN